MPPLTCRQIDWLASFTTDPLISSMLATTEVPDFYRSSLPFFHRKRARFSVVFQHLSGARQAWIRELLAPMHCPPRGRPDSRRRQGTELSYVHDERFKRYIESDRPQLKC